MNSASEKWITVLVTFFLIALSFGGGYYVGFENKPAIEEATTLSNKENGKPPLTDFSLFWEAWNTINNKFVPGGARATTTDIKLVTDDEKVWGAIGGLARSLNDPYTVFLPPEQSKIFESDISGNFEGVGMEIGIRDNILTVVAPLKDSPAEKAGVKSGDKILKIDGEPSAELAVDQAVKKIRGAKDSQVTLTIMRNGDKDFKEIKITRGIINIPTIDTEIKPRDFAKGENPDKNGDGVRDDGVQVVRLYNFGATSPSQFKETLRKFTQLGSNKLLLDLRGNPGGYLEAAVDMASWFLPSETPIVIEKGRGVDEKVYRSKGYNIFNKNLKMVVLVDKGSASASEILAGALSEYGIATLVGEKTFGKGSVQELVRLGKDSSLKVTIARWYTPKGRSISENGLLPDVLVPITKEEAEKGIDSQLLKAIEILNK